MLKPGRIDAFGFLVLAIWLGTMQTVLNKGQDEDWFNSNFICTLSVISVIAFIAFVIREFSIREPLADLRVFADRNFCSCTVLVGHRLSPFVWHHELAAAHGGKPHGLHRLRQRIGASAARPGRIGLHAAGGNLIGKVDDRLLIGPGMILIAVASLMMGNFNLDISSHDFFWPNFIQGMGMALTMVPLMTVAMATIRNEQMGNATGLFALARNLAGSIGIAVAIAMVSRGALRHQAYLTAHLTPYDLPYQNAVQVGQVASDPRDGRGASRSRHLGRDLQISAAAFQHVRLRGRIPLAGAGLLFVRPAGAAVQKRRRQTRSDDALN